MSNCCDDICQLGDLSSGVKALILGTFRLKECPGQFRGGYRERTCSSLICGLCLKTKSGQCANVGGLVYAVYYLCDRQRM